MTATGAVLGRIDPAAAALRARVDELEEHVRALTTISRDDAECLLARGIRLRGQKARAFAILRRSAASAGVVPHDAIALAMRHHDEIPSREHVHQVVRHLRHLVEPAGYHIGVVYGVGYRMRIGAEA